MSTTRSPWILLAVAIPVWVLPCTAHGQSIVKLVDRLLAGDEVNPTLHQPDPAAPYDVDRQFLFDDLESFEAKALLLGVTYVSAKFPAPADEGESIAHRRAMLDRYQRLLDYYPVMARGPEDFHQILALVEDGAQPPLLREFLIRRCAPGLEPRSALGEYLQGMLAGAVDLDNKLAKIIENPTEFPNVQVAAVEAVGANIAAFYTGALEADPLARESEGRGNPARTIADFKEAPDSVPLTRRTRLRIELRSEDVWRIGKMLSTVARDPNRDHRLREAAESLAATIARDYPIPNADALQAETLQQPPRQ